MPNLTTRRSILLGLPATALVATVPALAAPDDDPLLVLIQRFEALSAEVGEYRVAPADLVARWTAVERAMIGVRPTTREGAFAALRMATVELEEFDYPEPLGWLCRAALDFVEAAAQ